ncbi:MAG: hypothetical protein ACTSQL_10135 [Promethearchaeota archaeon]
MSGSDVIVGRTPEISIKIKYSGQIIKKFENLFNENLQYFLDGQYMNFFKPFLKIKGVDENHISEIYQDIQIKLAAMHGTEFDLVLMYTIVISSLTTSIREIQFNYSLQEIIMKVKKQSANLSKKQIQGKLEKLYNLSYIAALAESFNYLKTARICKIQRSKYINRIVDLVTNPNDQISK